MGRNSYADPGWHTDGAYKFYEFVVADGGQREDRTRDSVIGIKR
ncbi:hypothetical protein [Streptomyces sp. NPDC004284]